MINTILSIAAAVPLVAILILLFMVVIASDSKR